MITVLYGTYIELIEDYISKFIKKNKIKNIIKYDYEDVTIDDVINELSYPDLFGEIKLIILYNSKFLTSEDKLESDSFEKYIKSPNNSNYLFLITESDTLDERKKIVKELRKSYDVISFDKFSEYDAIKYINKSFNEDDYKIEDKAVKEMISRLSLNIGIINNEIEKLKLYKLDDKNITLENIYKITSKLPEDNVFKLVDAVINNDKTEIFKLYDDFKLIGVDEIALIGLLASQFRFMYQVKVLMDNNKNKFDIISILKSHPYKTEITMKKVSAYSENKIIEILHKLAVLDSSIKSGEFEKSYALENFFLNL